MFALLEGFDDGLAEFRQLIFQTRSSANLPLGLIP